MKLKMFAIAAMALSLAACKSSGNSSDSEDESEDKSVIKVETTDVQGNLGKCFAVEDQDYELTGEEGSQVLTVKLKRTQEALPYNAAVATVTPFDGDGTVLVGFGIEYLDKDGNTIYTAGAQTTTDLKDAAQCVSLAGLAADQSGELAFSITDKDMAAKIAKFRISAEYKVVEQYFQLEGLIDNQYAVSMQMAINAEGVIVGDYYYTKSGPNAKITMEGMGDGKSMFDFTEYSNGTECGNWSVTLDTNANPVTMTGDMVNFKGANYLVNLTGKAISKADYKGPALHAAEPDDYADDAFADAQGSASSSAGDLDALLDRYENCIMSAAAMYKKAANGDFSVAQDVMSLQSEIMQLSEELQSYPGDFNPSQMKRLNDLMLRAADFME